MPTNSDYKKYEAAKRAEGKLCLKDLRAEAVVAFAAEGYAVGDIPGLLATYLDMEITGDEITAYLAKSDVQKRLATVKERKAEADLDKRQPVSVSEYQQYAMKKLWHLAKREDEKVAIQACVALLKLPPEASPSAPPANDLTSTIDAILDEEAGES